MLYTHFFAILSLIDIRLGWQSQLPLPLLPRHSRQQQGSQTRIKNKNKTKNAQEHKKRDNCSHDCEDARISELAPERPTSHFPPFNDGPLAAPSRLGVIRAARPFSCGLHSLLSKLIIASAAGSLLPRRTRQRTASSSVPRRPSRQSPGRSQGAGKLTFAGVFVV